MSGTIVLITRTDHVVPRKPKESLPVREATRDDIPALAELYQDAYTRTGITAGSEPVETVEQAQGILTRLFDGDYGPFLGGPSLVVVDDDDQVVAASLVIERRTGDHLPPDPYLFELFTRSDHRRRGLAEDLVHRSARSLAESGYERLSLRIAEDNFAAMALYLTLSFTRWSEADESDEI